MLFLLAFKICLHKMYLFQPSSSEGFVGQSDQGHDLCNISFRYLLLLHGGPERCMNKAVLSSKCIHSLNKFLKIMEQLLSNGEIIHSQGSVQILKAKVVLGFGISVSRAQPNRKLRKCHALSNSQEAVFFFYFPFSDPGFQCNNRGRKFPITL